MGKKPIIKAVERTDEDIWHRLWTAYLTFYNATVPEEVYEVSFKRLLAGNQGAENEFHGLIAWVEGEPVGLVHFLFHRHMWRIENSCYLQDLFVDPACRGVGLGRALIEAVYERADAAHCPSVYWLTQEDNHTARKLYDHIAKKTPFIQYAR